MSIDYLHEKWNLMSNNITRQGTERRNTRNNNNNKVVSIRCRRMKKEKEKK
jgi:hypothetical protein